MTIKQLIQAKPLVLDGALGTELESIIPNDSMLQPKSHPLWSGILLLHKPELISQIHYKYLQEGSDLITTSTYQTSYFSLRKYTNLKKSEIKKLWNKSIEVGYSSIKRYKEQTKNIREIHLVGSIGPYGSYLHNGAEYTGNYGDVTNEQLEIYHFKLLYHLLLDKRVGVVGVETVPNFKESKVILNLIIKCLTQLNINKEFYISFNFANENDLCDGTSIEKLINYLNLKFSKNKILRNNMLGIGLNCVDCNKVTSIIASINRYNINNLPIIVYPNLGFYYNGMTDSYDVSKDINKWKQLVKQWLNVPNVRIVGGCCSTGPEEIKEVRTIIDEIYK